MNKNKLVSSMKLKVNKGIFKIKKHSPELLIGGAIVCGVASTISACVATTKLSKILEDREKSIEEIKEYSEREDMKEEYTKEDAENDIKIITVKSIVNIAKLYTPAFILGVTSITCMLASTNILKKRNAAISAAYATLNETFKNYRERVADRFGEDIEKEIKYNVKTEKIKTVDENGEEVEKEVKKCDADGYSEYARFFDDGCNGWEKDPEYNLMFLKAQERYANDLLRTRGHVFLNEVYDMLGIPRTKAGQVVGWVYDEDNPNVNNYIDFGIFDVNKSNCRDFVNGYERVILLDFNVDGNVLEMM